ncbi:MAG: glycosyltransferase [Calditrichaeota bacterium]|nr:glycosyltransferase [Calditrichota bacterium]
MFLHTIFLLLTIGYISLIIALIVGLYQLRDGKNKQKYFVSVIVAAHNEAENISRCLSSLLRQTYPQELYEIIVIDDRSNDGTIDVVKKYQTEHKNIRSLRIERATGKMAPKKFALSRGIANASGEIILTTDADTIPVATWVETMVRHFEPSVGLVAGFSPLDLAEKDNFISRFIALDSLSLAAVAAGSTGLGNSLTCNGRNLGYRKKAFDEVGGFQKIAQFISGDDDLLLHLIKEETDWEIRYAFDRGSLVHARQPKNFSEFANQRIRHASKGKHYSPKMVLLLSGIYFYNLLLIGYFFGSLFAPKFIFLWLTSFMAKGIADFLLMNRFAMQYRLSHFLTSFPWAAFLHPIYVTIFGLWGQFGKFKWKGKTYNAKSENGKATI